MDDRSERATPLRLLDAVSLVLFLEGDRVLCRRIYIYIYVELNVGWNVLSEGGSRERAARKVS